MIPNWVLVEKSVSKSQQRLMGMVHNYKKHGGKASSKVKDIASGISNKDAEDFAGTKHKGLPDKVGESFETTLTKALFS